MLDFLALMFESLLGWVIAIFDPIQSPVWKAILEIIAMAVVSVIFISLVYLLVHLIKK